MLAQRPVSEARNVDGGAALTPRHFASVRLRQRVSFPRALNDEWRRVMLYAVSAKLILDRATTDEAQLFMTTRKVPQAQQRKRPA
jgi:hypothetical protein